MEQSILSPLRPYVFRYTKKRWFGCHISYYSNSCACFNGMELSIQLSGDIHPLPGPTNTHTILVCMGNRPNHHKPGSRGHVKSNYIEIKPAHSTKAAMHTNQNNLLKLRHLNAESLRRRQHLIETREMVLQNNFDILTISETWFNMSVTNASVEIEGYKLHRLDRIGKSCAGVCAYIKANIKATILKDLTGITASGLHQLWIQVQIKKMRSILVCVVYRLPDIGVTCLQEELMPNYIQAFSLNKDVILMGDLNCDLCVNPRSKALRSLCSSLNATKLIDKPTRVTQSKCSLLDVVIISNPNLVHSSGVQELTISDHFWVFVTL